MPEKKIKPSTIVSVALGTAVVGLSVVALNLAVKNNAALFMISAANEVVEELGGTSSMIVDKYVSYKTGI